MVTWKVNGEAVLVSGTRRVKEEGFKEEESHSWVKFY